MARFVLAALLFTGAHALKTHAALEPQPLPAGCKNLSFLEEQVAADALTGFKSRTTVKPEKWEKMMNESIRKAKKDPCNADVITTSYSRFFGFGSRVNSFALEIFTAMYNGRSVALCDGGDHFIQNVWAPYFDNAFDLPVCTAKAKCNVCSEWEALHIGSTLSQGLVDADPEYVADAKRFVYPYVFTLNQATKKQISDRLAAAGMKKREAYVAVHVRHGDKIVKKEAAYLAPATYAKEAEVNFATQTTSLAQHLKVLQDTLAQKPHIKLVYVAGDDAEAAPMIQKALGSTITVVSQPPLSDAAYASRSYDKPDEVLHLLTDVEALRASEVFIGTATCNLARLVYFLRGKEHPSTTLDSSWMAIQA